MRITALLGLAGLLALGAGCVSPRPPPRPSLGKERVLEAARAVIQERYAMSTPLAASSSLIALTPVAMEGGYKTQKQIAVWVRPTATGAWEPAVRVLKRVDVSEPELGTEKESAYMPWGPVQPVRGHEWLSLQYLPHEEEAIYQAILERLET